jgi:hypothetical protein
MGGGRQSPFGRKREREREKERRVLFLRLIYLAIPRTCAQSRGHLLLTRYKTMETRPLLCLAAVFRTKEKKERKRERKTVIWSLFKSSVRGRLHLRF